MRDICHAYGVRMSQDGDAPPIVGVPKGPRVHREEFLRALFPRDEQATSGSRSAAANASDDVHRRLGETADKEDASSQVRDHFGADLARSKRVLG